VGWGDHDRLHVSDQDRLQVGDQDRLYVGVGQGKQDRLHVGDQERLHVGEGRAAEALTVSREMDRRSVLSWYSSLLLAVLRAASAGLAASRT
jgi:hypothetical protein